MSTPSIAERVAAGVEWLNEHRPGWWKPGVIDLERFNISTRCDCIIGQIYGDYWNAPLVYDGVRPASRGFNAHKTHERRGLQAEWVRVIQERRTQAGASS